MEQSQQLRLVGTALYTVNFRLYFPMPDSSLQTATDYRFTTFAGSATQAVEATEDIIDKTFELQSVKDSVVFFDIRME